MKIDTNRAHSQWQTKYVHSTFIFHFPFHFHSFATFLWHTIYKFTCFVHFFLFFFCPFLRGFKSDEGYLCWSLPLSEFAELVNRKAFHVLQSCTNAILSTLETLGKDPSEPVDEETRRLLKVLTNSPTVMHASYFILSIDSLLLISPILCLFCPNSYSPTSLSLSMYLEHLMDARCNGKKRSFSEMGQQYHQTSWLQSKGSILWRVMTPQSNLSHHTSTANLLEPDSIFPSQLGQNSIRVCSLSHPTTDIVSGTSVYFF